MSTRFARERNDFAALSLTLQTNGTGANTGSPSQRPLGNRSRAAFWYVQAPRRRDIALRSACIAITKGPPQIAMRYCRRAGAAGLHQQERCAVLGRDITFSFLGMAASWGPKQSSWVVKIGACQEDFSSLLTASTEWPTFLTASERRSFDTSNLSAQYWTS
jgi:hypothetical protein